MGKPRRQYIQYSHYIPYIHFIKALQKTNAHENIHSALLTLQATLIVENGFAQWVRRGHLCRGHLIQTLNTAALP